MIGRRDGFERKSEEIAVGAEALEDPGEKGLSGDALSAAGRYDAEQDTGAVRALRTSGEEHVEAHLGEVLEFALAPGLSCSNPEEASQTLPRLKYGMIRNDTNRVDSIATC